MAARRSNSARRNHFMFRHPRRRPLITRHFILRIANSINSPPPRLHRRHQGRPNFLFSRAAAVNSQRETAGRICFIGGKGRCVRSRARHSIDEISEA